MSEDLKRANNIFGCLRSSEEPTASVVLTEPDNFDNIFGCVMSLKELKASHDTGDTGKIQ
jgi:hypothetical protein